MKPKVCVYAIMLNEERHVARWVASASDADQLVILDTGSSDRSVALARELGVLVAETRIMPWRFDDARNAALAMVPLDIDICLQLDLDEVLLPGWRTELDQVPDRERRWSYQLLTDSAAASGWASTSHANCHRRFGFRWRHPVHEVIEGPPPDRHLDSLVVQHLPDFSRQRDYLTQLQGAAASEPDNARMAFYLGREQVAYGKWAEARVTLERFLEMKQAIWPAERAEAYLMLAKMDHFPERWLWKAIAECPERREPYVALAVYLAAKQRWPEAAAMYDMALTRTDQTLYVNATDAWGEPFDRLGAKIDRHRINRVTQHPRRLVSGEPVHAAAG